MPCDHVSVIVPATKIDDVAKFLLTSLAHLDFKEMMRPTPTVIGMGEEKPWFWLMGVDEGEVDATTFAKLNNRAHIAFAAESKSSCAPILPLVETGK